MKTDAQPDRGIAPLLAPDVAYGDTEAHHAFERVWSTLVAGLKGESWNKSAAVIEEFRAASIPGQLRSTST